MNNAERAQRRRVAEKEAKAERVRRLAAVEFTDEDRAVRVKYKLDKGYFYARSPTIAHQDSFACVCVMPYCRNMRHHHGGDFGVRSMHCSTHDAFAHSDQGVVGIDLQPPANDAERDLIEFVMSAQTKSGHFLERRFVKRRLAGSELLRTWEELEQGWWEEWRRYLASGNAPTREERIAYFRHGWDAQRGKQRIARQYEELYGEKFPTGREMYPEIYG